MKGIQALVTGAGFLLLLLALPFIWLYEQVGGPLFVAIVLSIPAAIWWYRSNKRTGTVTKRAPLPAEEKTEVKARIKREAEAFHEHNKRIIRERERQNEREYFLRKHEEKANRKNAAQQSRVHHIENFYGELSINWRRQFEEIDRAWRNSDYDFARDWLQKLAYQLKSEEAPRAVHDKFKALMADFTRDDPLYAEVMRLALPVISDNPGIVQSQLAKQFPQFDAEQFRYAMYYGEAIGDVVRIKKGRSYALSKPTQAEAKSMAQKIDAEEAAKLLYELFEKQSWLLSVKPERHDDLTIEHHALSFILSVAEKGVTDWGTTAQAVRETVSLLMMDFLAKLMHPQSPFTKKTWEVSDSASSFDKIMSIIASEIRLSHPEFKVVH